MRPSAVVGDKVLVGSAFLDKEKVGDRALFCLAAKTGDDRVAHAAEAQPLGRASVVGNTVIVTGSNIGYDPGQLKGAKGFIACYDLADGKEKWHKEITGGVVACAALADGAAVVTATDGKVRAFDLDGGERRWIYDAKVALLRTRSYRRQQRLRRRPQGRHPRHRPQVGQQAMDARPGHRARNPVARHGLRRAHRAPAARIYVATCNLEGPYARQATVVVCIGEK